MEEEILVSHCYLSFNTNNNNNKKAKIYGEIPFLQPHTCQHISYRRNQYDF